MLRYHKLLISVSLNPLQRILPQINIYNESANIFEGFDVGFYPNDCWYFPSTASVVGMESIVTRAHLLYTHFYLTLGICSLIKPAAMEK